MLSRALILATVMISIGYSAIVPAQAQNLDAGKSPSQIFSSTCSACHRSQRGLLKTVQPGALPGFLREHYTTSRDMAQSLSAYVLSNGATDNRMGGGRLTKQGEDAKAGRQASEPRPQDAADPAVPGRRPRPVPPQEASRPDADGVTPSDPRAGRTKRGRTDQPPQTAPGPDGQPVAGDENAPANRQKQKMGKKKGQEVPKEQPAPVDAAKPVESKPVESKPVETTIPEADKPAPAVEPIRPPTPKPDVAVEPAKPAVTPPQSKPVEDAPAASSSPVTRPDPVPQVTPAPKPAEPTESQPAPSLAPSTPPAETTAPATPRDEAPPRPTISITPPPPTPPAGPAVAPISQ